MKPTTTQMDAAANPDVNAGNRRNKDREDFNVEVGLLSDYQFYTGFTQNISSGGLFIATHDILRVGTQFNVSFRIPGVDHVFSCNAEVRWSRTYDGGSLDEMQPGMGVRFVDLSEMEVGLINGYIVGRETLFHENDD
jgi:uncharacterized protein (TIGR02266 family)